MILYITDTKEIFDKFTVGFNPHGLVYSILDKKIVNIDRKNEIVKAAYDIVFNSAKTDTYLDTLVKEYFIDSDYYREQYDDATELEQFSIFANDLCANYNRLFDMCGGEYSTTSYFGTDGIEYSTFAMFVEDYSVDTPIITEVLVDDNY